MKSQSNRHMNNIPSQNSNQEQSRDGVFYCQVESYRATKDYLRYGRCVRFFGVQPDHFSRSAFELGVTTFTIDVDYWEFCLKIFGVKHARFLRRAQFEEVDCWDEDLNNRNTWYRLEVEFCERASNYLYATFSGESERYFKLKLIELVPTTQEHSMYCSLPAPLPNIQPQFLASAIHSEQVSQLSNNHFAFETFHVGQGMCSLVHNGHRGVLLDVGAGKPVTRKAYLKGSISNDLLAAVSPLESVDVVISHPDSDHWRILAWDGSLRAKVGSIYVPSGAHSLALKDAATISKVKPLADQDWKLCSDTRLRLLRSAPSALDSNGDCLVAVFERYGRRVLAAGDYVYQRFSSDTNTAIGNLHQQKYAAVVVPHHGDAASANNIVPADQDAKAFFSAGTHQGYGHPTTASMNAHIGANFQNIEDHTKSDIVRVTLL